MRRPQEYRRIDRDRARGRERLLNSSERLAIRRQRRDFKSVAGVGGKNPAFGLRVGAQILPYFLVGDIVSKKLPPSPASTPRCWVLALVAA